MAVESYITDCLTKEVGLRRESLDLHFNITLAPERRKKQKQKGDLPKLVIPGAGTIFVLGSRSVRALALIKRSGLGDPLSISP